jgi:hypothetical protein
MLSRELPSRYFMARLPAAAISLPLHNDEARIIIALFVQPLPEPSSCMRRLRGSYMSERKPVVLVVEDDPIIRMVTTSFVSDAGFEAVEADSADEAIRIPEARPFYRHPLAAGEIGRRVWDDDC